MADVALASFECMLSLQRHMHHYADIEAERLTESPYPTIQYLYSLGLAQQIEAGGHTRNRGVNRHGRRSDESGWKRTYYTIWFLFRLIVDYSTKRLFYT
jgi:hypothetical protein